MLVAMAIELVITANNIIVAAKILSPLFDIPWTSLSKINKKFEK